jgi:hydroxymethylpyrimidine pyrophosphatase-like HAD family hydrolase/ABC-type dipeptide/oligopeptide/nickel transport system ATPase component
VRYFCLTCDYDGTIARDGCVFTTTVEALKRVKASGRKLILATGRELPDLLQVFPEIAVFDRVVAENGALLYRPATQDQKIAGDPPPKEFVEELMRRGVHPISVGERIVATWHPWESEVLDTIRTLGLELQVIFNKNAVMVLPAGVNKATGMQLALEELGLSAHNVVGAGDAENDHAFLGICECSVAVQNALPALKDRCDWTTGASHGAGVEELIERLLSDDLQSLSPQLSRHRLLLGHTEDGEPFKLEPYGSRLLLAGPSGSGKSTTMTAILERLVESGYQVCLVDPEGDYDEFESFVTLGAADRIPGVPEILEVLNTPKSLTINLLGIALPDRPAFFQSLLGRIQELRSRTGRPHWIVIDEAHHLFPVELGSVSLTIPKELATMALISAHPDRIAEPALASVNCVIAVGADPQTVIADFGRATGKVLQYTEISHTTDRRGEVFVWPLSEPGHPSRVFAEPARAQLRRHQRKYAEGELGEDKSFYFRGREQKLNLRAQNMSMFAQIAGGVDEETWTHHLRNSDYSRWLRESVKDTAVADEVAAIEQDRSLNASESLSRILDTLKKHYATST